MRRRLGKKAPKGVRFKARPDQYPDEGPCPIDEGYDELSRPAFAIWIRLSVAPRSDLKLGRRGIAKLVGYDERHFSTILAELERKGFVELLPGVAKWTPTHVAVMRKPLLRRGHGFTKPL